MVTASHNPRDYNGMKLVREQSRPISGDTGLREVEALAARGEPAGSGAAGHAHAGRHPGGLRGAPARVRESRGVQAASRGDQRGQRWGRGGDRRSREAPSAEVLQGPPRARRFIPSRSAQSAAPGEPRRDLGACERPRRRISASRGDGDFDRCFLFDERGEFIEGVLHRGALGGRHAGPQSPAGRSSTTRG